MWKVFPCHGFQCTLQWCHNKHNGISNHWHLDCFTKPIAQAQIKENINALRHWPLWGEFTSDLTREFPIQRASNAENVSIWCMIMYGSEALVSSACYTSIHFCLPFTLPVHINGLPMFSAAMPHTASVNINWHVMGYHAYWAKILTGHC